MLTAVTSSSVCSSSQRISDKPGLAPPRPSIPRAAVLQSCEMHPRCGNGLSWDLSPLAAVEPRTSLCATSGLSQRGQWHCPFHGHRGGDAKWERHQSRMGTELCVPVGFVPVCVSVGFVPVCPLCLRGVFCFLVPSPGGSRDTEVLPWLWKTIPTAWNPHSHPAPAAPPHTGSFQQCLQLCGRTEPQIHRIIEDGKYLQGYPRFPKS